MSKTPRVDQHETPSEGASSTPESSSGRREYQPPALRHLGSIRDLTLAASGTSRDGGLGRHN